MTSHSPAIALVTAAAAALKKRVDEVNKLNVFPVPDGDTGTNMSLTMDAVVAEVADLPADADLAAICKGITHGSLMGARGNSGVILSQILRGLCDVVSESETVDTDLVARALARSVEVSFQAVRKPVEGTMLTVLRDARDEADLALRSGVDLDEMLRRVVNAAFESVRHTPELLPVLKENGVVDAGGFGLAILAEGLVAAHEGRETHIAEFQPGTMPLSVEPTDDWDDNEYLYCTEFLLIGDGIDRDVVQEFVSSAGGSELVVGGGDTLKVHVHTDDPGSVLSHMTSLGEVAEVHINNMRRQTAARSEALRHEVETAAAEAPAKPYAIVTVAAGEGLKDILRSLGADTIVNGGQTMNPSTAELLGAIESAHAERVILLPNNKNILMAAQQAAEHAAVPVGVVPTRSVPEAFSALLDFDPGAELDSNIGLMTEAASRVRTAEVTTAIKDSKGKVGDIKAGQVIGIAADEIECVGSDILQVAQCVLELILEDGEAVTLLAGEDLSDADLEALAARIAEAHPHIEVEAHRGEQPLYPLLMSVE